MRIRGALRLSPSSSSSSMSSSKGHDKLRAPLADADDESDLPVWSQYPVLLADCCALGFRFSG
eukprot:6190154-Pleurochrysis_carterae.AAC.1